MTWTKLHDLFEGRVTSFTNAEIIKNMREFPQGIYSSDDRGYTPLHIAVTKNDPLIDAIGALLNAYPNAVISKDLHGDMPMHLALHPNANSNLIAMLIRACPRVAFESNKEGLYCCANEEIIGLLIEANPSALRSRTKMGNLVQKKQKVVPQLVPSETFSRSNQHVVLDGTTSSSWRNAQVKSLADTLFEERSKQIRDGSYPLHIATSNGAPRKVIEMLMKAAPDVLSLTDKFGRTCLHLAVATGATIDSSVPIDQNQDMYIKYQPKITLDTIKLLYSMDKSQLSTHDVAKNLPLHTALQGCCSIECVKFLLQHYPHAIHKKNKDGMTPFEVALKFSCCSKDISDVLKQYASHAEL